MRYHPERWLEHMQSNPTHPPVVPPHLQEPDAPVVEGSFTDADGTTWEYSSYDGTTCVITRIETQCETLAVPSHIEDMGVEALMPECCMNSATLHVLELPSTVRFVGRKAFAYNNQLEEVVFAEGLEGIDGFAFMYAGLRNVTMPASLREIGEKAFYCCAQLAHVELNDGLLAIGEEAFAQTDLNVLRIPASVIALGARIIHPKHSSRATRVMVDPQNPVYLSDAQGFGTYVRDGDALTLVECRGNQPRFEALEGTRTIGPRALSLQTAIADVSLPEGLEAIEEAAFRGCKSLKTLHLPSTLRSIGPRAFYESGLRHVRLPAALREVDDSAFLVNGGPNLRKGRHAFAMEIDPANPRFFMHTGMLCEHLDNGEDKAIIYTGGCPQVSIPPSIRHLGHFLFLGASGIEELTIYEDLPPFDPQAFGVLLPIDRVRVMLSEQVDGRDELVLPFERNDSLSLNFIQIFREGYLDIETIVRASDVAIYYMLDKFDRPRFMLRRLSDPFMLHPNRERQMRVAIQTGLNDICTNFAAHQYNEGFEQLIDLGFIDETNLDTVIEHVHAAGGVTSAGYLLEMKRRRFGVSTFSEYDI